MSLNEFSLNENSLNANALKLLPITLGVINPSGLFASGHNELLNFIVLNSVLFPSGLHAAGVEGLQSEILIENLKFCMLPSGVFAAGTKEILIDLPYYFINKNKIVALKCEMKITGYENNTDDIFIPVSGISGDIQSGDSSLLIVIKDSSKYIEELSSRINGNVILKFTEFYNNGQKYTKEWENFTISDIPILQGSSSSSLNVRVNLNKIDWHPRALKLKNISSISFNKKISIRCGFDKDLQPFDKAFYNDDGDFIEVGRINYIYNSTVYMTVSES